MRDTKKWMAFAVLVMVGLLWLSAWGKGQKAEASPVLAEAENRIAVIFSDLTAFKADWNQIRQLPNNKTVLQVRILAQFSDPEISGPDALVHSAHEMFYVYGRRRFAIVGQHDHIQNLQAESTIVTSSIGWPFISADVTISVPQQLRAMRSDRADLVFIGHDVFDPNLNDLLDQAREIKNADIEILP